MEQVEQGTDLTVKEKLLLLLLGTVAVSGFYKSIDRSYLTPSVLAQSPPEALSFEAMDLGKIDDLLKDNIDNVQGQPGQWQFSLNQIPILVIADARANRMRIVSPILEAEKLSEKQKRNMLVANFHTALDARYAFSNGLVVASYVHPLDSLQERDFLSAINQVVSLNSTFGKTYSSGDVLFAPGAGRERQDALSRDNFAI